MKPRAVPAKANPLTAPNRFAGGGVAVLGEDFTDRETERAEIARSLRTPRGHIVVAGLRRMGKTSILLAVRDELVKAGDPVLYVDLWTASTIEDMTTRLAAAAAAVLGRRWQDTVSRLGRTLKLSFEVSESPTGLMIPVPKLEFRDAPVGMQRQRLVDTLDLLEQLATRQKAHLSVIIDEFQEIERLGSEGQGEKRVSAMRQVRAAIQHHRHVTYVFAGSDRRLIQQLHAEDGGALHNLGRKYDIGPIESNHFAKWIERRFRIMGIDGSGAGHRIIDVAGPRTRDVRTLAESIAELARERAVVTEALIDDGVRAVVRQRRSSYEADWKSLTRLQQNVLRAVAAEGAGLTKRDTRDKYGLGEASGISKTIDALTERAVLLRDNVLVIFDDPFYRAWVIDAALPDVGVRLPITFLPQRASRKRA